MDIWVIISIVASALMLVATFISYYFYVKNKIVNASIEAINAAEDTDKVKHEKMEIAISEVKRLLPKGATLLFSDAAIEAIIQKAFDLIEELAKKQK